MGKNRKKPPAGRVSDVHESRRAQVPGSNAKVSKKTGPGRSFDRVDGSAAVNVIKKRIRDITRKLEHSSELPADIRAEDERALAAYEQDLQEAERGKLKANMTRRYHMVRFFERQKATRRLKKLRKQITDGMPVKEAEDLEKHIHVAEVDLAYTQYSPLGDAYIGIYGSQDHSDSLAQIVEKPRPPMWFIVEQSLAAGTLEELRDRPPVSRDPRPLSLRNKPLAPRVAEADDRFETASQPPLKHGTDMFPRTRTNFEPSTQVSEHLSDGYASGGGFFDV